MSWPYLNEKNMDLPEDKHCDSHIGNYWDPDCLQWWLLINRLPAVEKMLASRMGVDPELYADYKGKRVRCTVASSMGDVGISFNLKMTVGYNKRVLVDDLSNFSDKP